MNKIIDFLENNRYGNLATSVNDEPYVRPFEYGYKTDEGIFFYTSDNKGVYSQLKENPKVCFCSTDRDLNYVELHGNIKFTNNMEYKEKIIEKSNFAKQIYKNATNEHLKVFYIPHGQAVFHESRGDYIDNLKF